MIPNGTQIESLHVFSMGILKLSCPWALFELRFRIIFPISLAENVPVVRRLSVI